MFRVTSLGLQKFQQRYGFDVGSGSIRVGFSRGTWDPGSHKILGPHTKSLLKLPHFVVKDLAVFRRKENKKKITVTGKS